MECPWGAGMNGKNLKDVWKHIEVTNEEMGAVKADVGCIKNDINWMKQDALELKTTNSREHKEINGKLWWILTTIIVLNILGIGISIYMKA